VDKIQQWLNERQMVYSLFGALYRGDLDTGFQLLKDTALLQGFAQKFDCALVTNANKVIKEIDKHEGDAEYTKMLKLDYNYLFFGPDHIVVPLWESIYRTKEKLLFGEPDITVRCYYQRFGLHVNDREPADHFSLELSFMARLCAMSIIESKQIFAVLETQRIFLEEHLLKWVPVLANEVLSHAKTTFWSGLTVLVYRWLENDLNEIKKVIKIRQKIVKRLSMLVKNNI
jgi:TorA maturation chaperone TorD